uniref:Uncharacterized protein n=1 Tax=Plectus sambesii TaxID=2011161 RepID=A0A914UKQ7_9BILA
MNESLKDNRWTSTKILGFRMVAVHVLFLLIVVIFTIIHFSTAWSGKEDSATLAAFVIPLIQSGLAFLAEGAFLFCLIRCKRTLLLMYSRYQLLFIVILGVNALFSFVVIAAGSTERHYYWSTTPVLIFIINYLTAGMILLEILLWRQFGKTLKCLCQEIMIVAPMKAREQHVVEVNKVDEHQKNNIAPAKKKPTEKKPEKENITELKEVHHYYTRMNVNGYVAKPAVIVRTPTLERKTYLGGTADDDSISLSSNEPAKTASNTAAKKEATKYHNKSTSFCVSDKSSSEDESSPDLSRKSPYEEIPLNWQSPSIEKRRFPKKRKERPKSEIIQLRTPSPEMVFQVLPPKPWPPHGP